MSVIAACYDGDRILVGTDSGSARRGVRGVAAQKVAKSLDGRTVVAFAGSMRWPQLVQHSGVLNRPTMYDDWPSAFDLCLAIRKVLQDDGAVREEPESGAWGVDLDGILVFDGTIYDLDGTLTPYAIGRGADLDPGFTAGGSGEELARGAWFGAIREQTRMRFTTAIGAAIHFSTTCCGGVVIHEVPVRPA